VTRVRQELGCQPWLDRVVEDIQCRVRQYAFVANLEYADVDHAEVMVSLSAFVAPA